MSDTNEFEPAIAKVFGEHFGYLEETMRLYLMTKTAFGLADFTAHGFEAVTRKVTALQKKMGLKIDWPKNPNKLTDDLRTYVEDASKNNFALLNAQAAVASWAGIEALVEDVLVALLMSHPEALARPKVDKVKVTLASFVSMSEEERIRHLLRELEISESGPGGGRSGAETFEPLLKVFDLSVPLKPETREALFELSNIRNVIVHRMHIADARLVEKCPKLGYKKGNRVLVKEEQVDTYFRATSAYAIALSSRVTEKYP
jgi:hypothetical protein